MTFQQLLKAYEFGELFPEIVTMLPQARTMRRRFEQAYDELSTLRPVASKKVIRYELMHDPDSKEDFVGADGQGGEERPSRRPHRPGDDCQLPAQRSAARQQPTLKTINASYKKEPHHQPFSAKGERQW